MRYVLTFLFAGILALGPIPAVAEQVRFTGQTRADAPLIKDAMRHVQLIASGKWDCASIQAVASSLFPDGYRPPGGPHPEGNAKTVYEDWEITLCGKKERFLVAIWSASPEPGYMFRVAYPAPALPIP